MSAKTDKAEDQAEDNDDEAAAGATDEAGRADVADDDGPVVKAGGRRRLWIAAGAIAAVVIAAVVVIVAMRGGGEEAPSDVITPSRDPKVIRVAPLAVIRPGATLRWAVVPGATRYSLDVITAADGIPSWRTEATKAEMVWPTSGAATIPGRYRYKIVALAADRSALAASAMLTIEVVN